MRATIEKGYTASGQIRVTLHHDDGQTEAVEVPTGPDYYGNSSRQTAWAEGFQAALKIIRDEEHDRANAATSGGKGDGPGMELVNKTNYRDEDLRRFVRAGLNSEGVTEEGYTVEIRYRRRNSRRRGVGGIGRKWIALNLPCDYDSDVYHETGSATKARRPHQILKDELIAEIAKTLIHEIAHNRGLRHQDMDGGCNSANTEWDIAWAERRTIRTVKRKQKQKQSPKERRASKTAIPESKVREHLVRWERKLKLARTKVRRYRAEVKRYERREIKIAAMNFNAATSGKKGDGPFIEYETKNFKPETRAIIDQANDIIEEYRKQGFALTLRQLYYQFVARAMIPNTERSYKRIGSIINNARLAGLIDWDSIEDRTRWLRAQSHWDTPAEIVESCASQFRVDRWENQKYRPEIWIEKDALTGVIEGVCKEFDVPYFACRGYVSQSEQWRAARRHELHLSKGQHPIVFHLGDHDPSGIDMTADNARRLKMFAGDGITVKRLALNMDQVEQYDPPPNPTKLTDARARGYIDRFGMSCWELDALEPSVINALIREEIEVLIDADAWEASAARQQVARERLREVAAEI